MSDETYTFEKARVRLEEIAGQVKRKDVSLEKSLDLLEEGVRLANLCTERIDHTQWRAAVAEMAAEETPDAAEPAGTPEPGTAVASEDATEGDAPDDGEACETPAAGAEAEGDLPSEDPHAAEPEAGAGDEAGEEPDPEA